MSAYEKKLLRWMGGCVVSIILGLTMCIAGGELCVFRASGVFLIVCGGFLLAPLWMVWEER